MSTVIYPSPIFGPIHSRRLGVSLGINLLPEDGKWCTFDCIYCECGFNKDFGPVPDVLTFAGNGEPTLHPQFAEIVKDTCALRDRYFPNAKISVLSNSTQVFKPEVFEALKKVDNNILKLDTVDADYIHLVNRPAGHYDVDALVARLKEFKGKVIIQTMFMKGTFEGRDVDNTSERFVRPWIETVKRIAPFEVMIYTIDRETPDHDLRKATHEELDGIADRLRKEGLLVSVSY